MYIWLYANIRLDIPFNAQRCLLLMYFVNFAYEILMCELEDMYLRISEKFEIIDL